MNTSTRSNNGSRARHGIATYALMGVLYVTHLASVMAAPAQLPLLGRVANPAAPNVVYTIDDSGSMAWRYMPDAVIPASLADDDRWWISFHPLRHPVDPHLLRRADARFLRLLLDPGGRPGLGSPAVVCRQHDLLQPGSPLPALVQERRHANSLAASSPGHAQSEPATWGTVEPGRHDQLHRTALPFRRAQCPTVNCNDVINEQIVPATYYQYNGGSVNAVSSFTRVQIKDFTTFNRGESQDRLHLLRQQEQAHLHQGPGIPELRQLVRLQPQPACTSRSPPPARPSRRRAMACGRLRAHRQDHGNPGGQRQSRKPGARRARLQRPRSGQLLQLALRRPCNLFHAPAARARRHRRILFAQGQLRAMGQHARFQRSHGTSHVPQVLQHPDDRRLLEQRGGLDSGRPCERRQLGWPDHHQSVGRQPISTPRQGPSPTTRRTRWRTSPMYYWNRDLRPELENKVKTDPGDPAFWQHMVNFTVGLGVNGTLRFPEDLADLQSGVKRWPDSVPGDTPTAIDDLWHAAINSRGRVPERHRSGHLLPRTFRSARRYRQPQRQRGRRRSGQPGAAGGQSEVPALLRHRTVDRRHQGHRTRCCRPAARHDLERRREDSGRTTHAISSSGNRSATSPRAVPFEWNSHSDRHEDRDGPGATAALVSYLRGNPHWKASRIASASRAWATSSTPSPPTSPAW